LYKGLILKESLGSVDVLIDDRIIITKEEIWKVGRRAVDWQPKVWTAIYVEGAAKDIEDIAFIVSNSILDKWYANLSDSTTEYVIFHKKIFSYTKGNDDTKQEAKNYGKSIGVPGHQLDW
jgi:hypothetical protein